MRLKKRKNPTPESLGNIALHYLERYAASEASLRRVLTNRLRRAALLDPAFGADSERLAILREAIEQIVAKYKKNGVLNDAAFAETKVNSLRRQGRSRRAIVQKLAAKGVRGSIAEAALAQHDDGIEPQDVEFKAALTLAKRRKLGPYRKTGTSFEQVRKDFAALARAGFSSDISRRVLKSEPPEDAAFDDEP